MDKSKIKTPAALRAFFDGDAENFAAATTPGGIEAQEARGQDRLVHSDLLPRSINGQLVRGGDMQHVCDVLGIKIVGEADDLFYNVELPVGWTKQATGHSMWSYVLDDKGRKRMSVFYKAAFYDRRAFVNIEQRYHGTYSPVGGYEAYDSRDDEYPFVAQVTDGEKVIWESQPYKHGEMKSWDLSKLSQQWLDEHFPDWRDEFAYWE